MHLLPLLHLILFPLVVAAHPSYGVKPPTTYYTVHQFPNQTWLENIAIRSNGQLLLTVIGRPELYLVDPANPKTAQLLHTFPNATSLMGIDEVRPDEFAIVAGNWSLDTFQATKGSYSIWTVTIPKKWKANSEGGGNQHRKADSNGLVVRKAASIPEAAFLNGLATLDSSTGTVLVADSAAGLIYRVSINNGSYSVALKDSTMNQDPSQPAFYPGVNGIKLHGGFAYFTNSGKGTFTRVKIGQDGTARGAYEVVSTPGLLDDFRFDPEDSEDGTPIAWATTDPGNVLKRIKADGSAVTVLGALNDTAIAGNTACVFGKGKSDTRILYVATNGGIVNPVNGFIEGGKVIAVAVDKL